MAVVEKDLFGNVVVPAVSKDWTGTRKSIYRMLGATNHCETHERESNDFYATDPIAGEWLLKLEKFNGPIWEPCCGQGHLSEVFLKHGFEVKSTDLVDRGYMGGSGGINFLNSQIIKWNGDIITNPPYKLAQEITEKALSIIPEGRKVAMFLKTLFLEGKRRRRLFEENPPVRVWISSSRLRCAPNGDFNEGEGSAVSYAWFVWEKGYKGDTILKWFN